MSSPIPTASSSSSSPALYVPVHRRSPSSSSSSSPSSSPSSSSRALSPAPTHSVPGVYTPAELLSLWHSPLVAQLSATREVLDALRAVAPEVVQTRKQRKASAWHARRPSAIQIQTSPTHGRASSRGSHSQSSESEEDRAISWRRRM